MLLPSPHSISNLVKPSLKDEGKGVRLTGVRFPTPTKTVCQTRLRFGLAQPTNITIILVENSFLPISFPHVLNPSAPPFQTQCFRSVTKTMLLNPLCTVKAPRLMKRKDYKL